MTPTIKPRFSRLALASALSVAALLSAALAAPAVEKSVKLPVSGVYQIVFNPQDGDLYVAAIGKRGENQAAILRLDAQTLDVVDMIKVGEAPVFGLGFSAKAQTLFGSATTAGAVTVIPLATKDPTPVKRPDGASAHLREVAVDDAANISYTTAYSSGDEPSDIWVVDGAKQALTRIISVDTPGASGLALDKKANRLFVASRPKNEIIIVDLSTDKIVARFPSQGENPINLAYDAAGGRLFVVHQKPGGLAVLNAESGALIKTVETGENALGVLFDPKLNRIYVANRGAGTVTVIDGESYAVIANLTTGTFPQTLALDPETSTVYVTNKAQGLPRNAPAGAVAPDDPNGDTVTIIKP